MNIIWATINHAHTDGASKCWIEGNYAFFKAVKF